MIRERDVLKLLRSRGTSPQTREEVHRHFGTSGREAAELDALLERLQDKGEVVRVKKGRFAIPRELSLVVGRLEVNQRGFGFVIPEKDAGGDIYIHSEDMSTALHGDKVLVRLHSERRRRGRPGRSGQIIRILERGHKQIVGTLARTGSLLYLLPDNPAFVRDIYVDSARAAGARPGQKVTVRIVSWPSRHLNPEGEVLEILGPAGLPSVDTLSVIREYNLREAHPEAVVREAEEVARPVMPEEGRGRLDLRDRMIFTVDPDDARDFDDAISLEKTAQNTWRLGVHISDVSHYVPPGSALDEEARRRGTSVYFPARVLHMLPPELSTGICSLQPQADRLTQSVFITFNLRGERLQYEFAPSLIRSRRRFTYGEIRKIVVEREKKARDQEGPLTAVIDAMASLAGLLRQRRFERGALDLDLPEEKIIFNEQGLISAVELEEQDLAHSIIEEFMLAANEAVAEHLARKKAPLIYRVHDLPSRPDLREFAGLVEAFGYRIRNPADRREIQSFLNSFKGTPLGYTLQTAYLRSLKQAEYSRQNTGHFGLASPCYTYFTSPIRRYPDLYNHRLLGKILRQEKPAGVPDLEALARHCSETERAADEAEKEVVLLRKLQFFQQRLDSGESPVFEAVITGVKNYGIHVYLNRYLIGGLVHVSSLTDDFYRLDRSGTVLEGRRTRRQFRLGDVLRVRVEKVDLVKRQVDFKIFPSEKF